MPDILIRGVQFPTMQQEYKTLIVSYDGKVYEGVYPQPTAKKKEPIAHAVELPEHGDLIDRDALLAEYERDERAADEHGRDFSFSFYSGGTRCTEWWIVQQKLMDAHAIVPSNKEETK